LISNPASASAGRALAVEILLFDQHDIFHPALRQVIGSADTHHAAANNHNLCGVWNIHVRAGPFPFWNYALVGVPSFPSSPAA